MGLSEPQASKVMEKVLLPRGMWLVTPGASKPQVVGFLPAKAAAMVSLLATTGAVGEGVADGVMVGVLVGAALVGGVVGVVGAAVSRVAQLARPRAVRARSARRVRGLVGGVVMGCPPSASMRCGHGCGVGHDFTS